MATSRQSTGPSSKQKSILHDLLPLFQKHSVIGERVITNVYNQEFRRTLSIRKYQFKGMDDLYYTLDVFDRLSDSKVSISRSKLLACLLKPMQAHQGAEPKRLDEIFEIENGFPPMILCNFCQTSSLKDLLLEVFPITQQRHQTRRHLLSTPPVPSMSHRPLPQLGPAQIIPNIHPAVMSPVVPTDLGPVHFPNSDIHLKDETYLPPITGHPRMEVPSDRTRRSLALRPVFKQGEKQARVMEKVDNYIRDFILCLSKQGKHLPLDVVDKEFKSVCNDVRKCGIRIDKYNVKSWSDFDKLQKRLNAFISTFCWNCPITTLYELNRTILEFEKVTSFDELHIGPIQKHPIIQDLFKIPDDLDVVPEITVYDIQQHLHEFIKKHKKGDKHKLEEFMQLITEKRSAKSPQHLCIRISSFPMALSVVFKFWTSQRLMRERLEKKAEEKIEEMIDFEISQLQKSLRRMSQNEKELSTKTPVQLIEDIYNLSLKLFDSRTQSRVMTFFSIVLKNASLRNLFAVALYQGAYGVQKMVQEQESHVVNTAISLSKEDDYKCYKPRNELVRVLIEFIERLRFPVDLESLAKAEQQLVEKMGVQHFHSFGHDSFLHFVSSNHQVIKALGGRSIGSTDGQKDVISMRGQVLSFVHQLKDISDIEVVSMGISREFCVDSVQQLGCGSVEKLILDSKHSSRPIPFINYTVPLLLNGKSDSTEQNKGNKRQHGILGPQTPNDAYDCLEKAPLLSDLSEWSQWDIVYAPSLGSLCEFLVNQSTLSMLQPIFVLQATPGQLLKINRNSSLQDFTAAVERADPINTAGHLVSLVVIAGSVHEVSTLLFASHVSTKLEKMAATVNDDLALGKCTVTPASFVYQCLSRIPLHLCDILGKQVFIEPLRKVTSSSNVDQLLKFCETSKQRGFLQALGMKLGIKAWIDDFKGMQNADQIKFGSFPTGQPNIITPHNKGTPHEEQTILQKISPTTNKTEKPNISQEGKYNDDMLIPHEFDEVGKKNARQIINSIRQHEFGIGLKLDLHQQTIADKQKEREGRGLQRLSQELYSKDTHFVLELVQNADDNTYPKQDQSSVPTLKFVLSKDCITVLNNEVGFTEKNIRAICDVGKSTKDPHRSGYIGQKGIGFKSVFRITNKPEIHSQGFHIRFNTQSGPIGYILPEWVDESFLNGKNDVTERKIWNTEIVLPLKIESSVSRNMVNKFQDIQPSLLLFLNRLRCIIIHDTETNEVRKMDRIDKEAGITDIIHDDGCDKWLVVRKQLDNASQYKPGVEGTELALAFPLPEDLKSPFSARDLQSQQVFAFLPLRSYGFRFIVQGDFDLPSSREDVNSDTAWNQWLREKIASLFLEASTNMKALPGLTDIEAIALFIQFIPLEGEVHDFFKPVTGQILHLLKGSGFLPTDPVMESCSSDDVLKVIINLFRTQIGSGEKSVIVWKQPSQLLRASHDVIREYIPQTILSAAVNLHYLNSSLVSTISPDLCSQLTIGSMTIDHLIAVAEYALKRYHENRTNAFAGLDVSYDSYMDEEEEEATRQGRDSPHECFVEWIAHWLACVHIILEETRDVSAVTLSKIKKLPIIPLSDESLVSIDTITVFFPPDSEKEFEKSFRDIYKELKMIDSNLLNIRDQLISAMVYKMLSIRLEVKELNCFDIIYHHIIPQFKEGKQQNKSDKLLILYLAFIKNGIDRGMVNESKIIADLKEDVVIVTNRGRQKPNRHAIHLSSDYKGQWNLSNMFPGVKWTEVSKNYLQVNMSQNVISDWKQFFIKLGVKSGLAVERINEEIDPKTDAYLTKWDISEWKRSPDGKYTVRDYYCKEFDLIVESVSTLSPHVQVQQMTALVNMLDQCWDAKYKQFVHTTYHDGSNTHELGTTMSTFGQTLATKRWLPAVNKCEPYQASPMLRGNELYCDSETNKQLLHHHVPYLGSELKSYDFAQHLKIKMDISASTLLNYLQQWSRRDTFTTTIDHMINVYIFLARESNVEFFENIVFVPSIEDWRYSQTDEVMVKGRFLSIHNVCWADKTTVLYNMLKNRVTIPSHLPQVLSFFYYNKDEAIFRNIKRSFEALRVEKGLKLQSLVDLLEFNASLTPNPEQKHVDDFRSIADAVVGTVMNWSETDQSATEDESKQSFFLSKIKDQPIFPSTTKKWATLETLFIDDRPEISKQFSNSTVHFLDWSTKKGDRTRRDDPPNYFTEICRIPLLSEHVDMSMNPSGIRPFEDLQWKFHHMIPIIQCYIIARLPHFQKPSEIEFHSGIQESLRRLHIFSTIDLSCTYSIKDKDIYSPAVQIKQCRLGQDMTSPVVYAVVNKDGKILEKSSLVEVLKLLFLPRCEDQKFLFFLQELIMNEPCTTEEKQDVMEKHGLNDIPEEIPEWYITPPKQPHIEEVEEDSDIEEDEDEEDEEKEEKDVSDDKNVGLKSWPPRAAVVDHGSSKKPVTRRRQEETLPTTADVVTHEDVLRMRKEAGQDVKDTKECNANLVSVHSGSQNTPPSLARSTIPPTKDHSLPSQQTAKDKLKNSPENDKSSVTKTIPGPTTKINDEQINSKSPSNPPQQPRKHQPMQKKLLDVQSVDIGSLMQSVPVNSSIVLVPDEKGKESKMEVGRWGEMYVTAFLQKECKLPNGLSIKHIEWVNETVESGFPYDIKVTAEDGEYFVEVKSTSSADKALIPISWKELQYAKEKKSKYLLFRVYNALKQEDVKMKWLPDIFSRIESNPSVRLFITL